MKSVLFIAALSSSKSVFADQIDSNLLDQNSLIQSTQPITNNLNDIEFGQNYNGNARKLLGIRKRRKKRVPVRGSRRQVWNGTRQKVKTTGQTKSDLMKNKTGKIVSKKATAAGKTNYKRNGEWTKAFMQARKNLGLKGFVPCKKGTKFYKEAMRLYKA